MLTVFAASLLLATTPEVDRRSELCPALGQLAATIMEQRQAGAPMSTLLATVDPSSMLSNTTRLMIMQAYRRPRHHSPQYIRRAAEDFRIEFELACYEAQGSEPPRQQ